jgi:plasmid stabilization system protein ParE
LEIIWAPEAADDLDAVVVYLTGRNPAAARALAEAVLTLVERLASEPIDGPVCELRTGEKVSSWPLRPFRIYYQREQSVLRVVRVYHQKREPIAR